MRECLTLRLSLSGADARNPGRGADRLHEPRLHRRMLFLDRLLAARSRVLGGFRPFWKSSMEASMWVALFAPWRVAQSKIATRCVGKDPHRDLPASTRVTVERDKWRPFGSSPAEPRNRLRSHLRMARLQGLYRAVAELMNVVSSVVVGGLVGTALFSGIAITDAAL